MAGDPESLYWAQALEKYGFPGGVIVGAVFSTMVLFRVIKSGFLVFGDKAKLLVDNEVLHTKLDLKMKEVEALKAKLADRDKRIDQLMGGQG